MAGTLPHGEACPASETEEHTKSDRRFVVKVGRCIQERRPTLKNALLIGTILCTGALAATARADDSPIPLAPAASACIAAAPSQGAASQTEFSAQGPCTVTNECNDADLCAISCSSESGDCHSDANWVECDGERTYCDSDCPCSASATCSDGSTLYCEGADYCQAFDDCWVWCDDQRTWCPDPAGLCPH